MARRKRESEKLRIVELQESASYWTEKVLEGTCGGLAIVGPGGLGKTHTVEELLRKRQVSTEHIGRNSHITPLALYKTLYEHRTEPVILLDDIEHVYKDDVSTGILRSALWGRKTASGRRRRVVTYSTSKDISVPERFEYRGGIILIGNKIPKEDDPIVEALLTRIPHVRFEVSPKDVYAFMRQVMVGRSGYSIYSGSKGQEVRIPRTQCNEVISELEARGVTDLRTLEHALIAWLDFRRDRKRFSRELDNIARAKTRTVTGVPAKRRSRELFLELVSNTELSENEKAESFTEKTKGLRPGRALGYNRATYFRWKKKWEEGRF